MFSWRLAGAAVWFAILNVQMTTCRSPGESGSGAQPTNESAVDVNLKEVDTSQLTSREKRLWSEQMRELLAPCPDQPVSLVQCIKEKRACHACVVAADFLGKSIARGLTAEQVESTFRARFSPAQVKKIEVSGSPQKGAENPSVVIVEWADFECPACIAARPVISDVVKRHPDDVRLVFKHFPLSAHENAELAARAAVAADKQGKFWQMHHALFEQGPPLKRSTIEKIARSLELDMARFEKDLESEATADTVAKDRKQGESLGLSGTPTLFINGRRFVTAGEFEADLKDWVALEVELKSAKKAVAKPPAPAAASASATKPRPAPAVSKQP